MCDTKKPRFKVDEPVYVKMGGYKVKGFVKRIGKYVDNKGEYFIYTVDDENGNGVYPDFGVSVNSCS